MSHIRNSHFTGMICIHKIILIFLVIFGLVTSETTTTNVTSEIIHSNQTPISTGFLASSVRFFNNLVKQLNRPPARKTLICVWKICSPKVASRSKPPSTSQPNKFEKVDHDGLPKYKFFDEYAVNF